MARAISCGSCIFPTVCGGGGEPHRCGARAWHALGNSAVEPWTEPAPHDSASGVGVSGPDTEGFGAILYDGLDRLWAAWIRDDLYVLYFDGVGWVEAPAGSAIGDGISATGAAGGAPVFALHANGLPMVAWVDSIAVGSPMGTGDIFVRRYDGSAWVELGPGSASGGGVSQGSSQATLPVLGVDGAGSPIIAWTDGNQVYARSFDGSAWIEMDGSATGGGISRSAGSSTVFGLANDLNGQPVVAWLEAASQILVRRYDGSQWTEVGVGSATGAGVSQSIYGVRTPSFASNSSGELWLAWRDGPTDRRLFEYNDRLQVIRFDGTTWSNVASDLAPNEAGRIRAGPYLIREGAELRVSWADDTNTLQSRRLSAGTWQDDPMPSFSFPGSRFSLATRNDGQTAIGYQGGPTALYIRQLRQGAWQPIAPNATVAGISNSVGRSQQADVALDDLGMPIVAWVDDSSLYPEIYVKRFDGYAWVELGSGSASAGGISNLQGFCHRPTIDARAGNIVVAWLEAGSGTLYIRSFDGLRWVELGPGSASGRGMDNNAFYVPWADVALDSTGAPTLAWASTATGIYVKRFNGSSWQEVGAGSASGTGLANTTWNFVYFPAVAINPDDLPIVGWSTWTMGGFEVYAAQFDGATWVELGTGSMSGGGVTASGANALLSNVAVDGMGRPLISWFGNASTNPWTTVLRFEAGGWQDLGGVAGSAMMAVDSIDRPVLIWTAQNPQTGARSVYLRRHDGANWSEVGGASASGTGISNSDAVIGAQALVASDQLLCVAWQEAARSTEIMMRCTER